MSKAYMIRGQGIGVMHDKVYLEPPPPEAMRAALVEELKRHGVAWSKDDKGELQATSLERWVQTQIVEIIDGKEMGDIEGPARIVGSFDDKELAATLAEVRANPPGWHGAAAQVMSMTGTGIVTPPGQTPPGAETQTITSADVGVLPTLSTPPAKVAKK